MSERGPLDDIIEEEAGHDVLLDPVWDSIEILLLLEEHLTPVHLPVIPEMALDLTLERWVDVLTAPVGLVLDSADQVEPLLKFLLVQAVILSLQGDNDVLELVHQDGEEGDAKDLNDAAEDLLHDRDRAKVTISNG